MNTSEEWRCGNPACRIEEHGQLLGKIKDNTITVIRKDIVVKIPEGSKLVVRCPRCNRLNTIYASSFINAFKDGAFSHIKTPDGQELNIKVFDNSDGVNITFEGKKTDKAWTDHEKNKKFIRKILK